MKIEIKVVVMLMLTLALVLAFGSVSAAENCSIEKCSVTLFNESGIILQDVQQASQASWDNENGNEDESETEAINNPSEGAILLKGLNYMLQFNSYIFQDSIIIVGLVGENETLAGGNWQIATRCEEGEYIFFVDASPGKYDMIISVYTKVGTDVTYGNVYSMDGIYTVNNITVIEVENT